MHADERAEAIAFLCVCIDALPPSKHFFSHVWTISCILGLKQFSAVEKVSCSRA